MQVEALSCTLTDLNGRVVYSSSLQGLQGNHVIELQHLPAGMYFCSLNSGLGTKVFKLQVNH
jgi:hypothetical protein